MVAVSLKKFFQAEDGIRDAQESRGLGDVYKRQPFAALTGHDAAIAETARRTDEKHQLSEDTIAEPVSYTHLTLPTILRV